jgi:hypothetical protein
MAQSRTHQRHQATLALRNFRNCRKSWASLLAFAILLGAFSSLALPASDAMAGFNTNNKKRIEDVAITGLCHKLRAPTGYVVTVTNQGNVAVSNVEVIGGTVLGGGESAEFYTRSLGFAPLQPGESRVVFFSGSEIRDYGADNDLFIFSARINGDADDARPDNNSLQLYSLDQTRPCPLVVLPRL